MSGENQPQCTEIERITRIEMRNERNEEEIRELFLRIDKVTAKLEENNRLLNRAGGMIAGVVILLNMLWIGGLAIWQAKGD